MHTLDLYHCIFPGEDHAKEMTIQYQRFFPAGLMIARRDRFDLNSH